MRNSTAFVLTCQVYMATNKASISLLQTLKQGIKKIKLVVKEEVRFKCLLWARHSARGLMFIFSFNPQNKLGSRCCPHTSAEDSGAICPFLTSAGAGFWDPGLCGSKVHTLPTTACTSEATTAQLAKTQQLAHCRGYFSSSHIPFQISKFHLTLDDRSTDYNPIFPLEALF